MARTKQPKDRHQLAVALVDEWFNDLCAQSWSFTDGTNAQSFGTDTFDLVQNACKAINQKDESDEQYESRGGNEQDAREAGYLIGLQIGLRLRERGR